jgi:hypothetical protein
MKDPKKLRKQRPDYVKDPNWSADPDRLPLVGGDPEDLPQPGEREIPEPESEHNPEEREEDRD